MELFGKHFLHLINRGMRMSMRLFLSLIHIERDGSRWLTLWRVILSIRRISIHPMCIGHIGVHSMCICDISIHAVSIRGIRVHPISIIPKEVIILLPENMIRDPIMMPRRVM